MLLWISFALLTAAVVAALMRPLLAARGEAVSAAAADLAVYKDQLAEVAADRERGLIGEKEAEAARNEIARRLLAKAGGGAAASLPDLSPPKSSRQQAQADSRAGPRNAGRGLIAASLLIPVSAIALYAAYGSPQLPARPYAARAGTPLDKAPVVELVARVEARLRAQPDDGEGWDVIGPVYLRMQRFQDAADAFANALRLKGESVSRLSGLAEALVMANGGVVPEAARLAYEKLVKLAPDRAEPRFWLALAKEQDGKLAEAVKDYRALLDTATPSTPWREAVAQRLREVMARQGASPDEITRAAGAPPAAGAAGRGEAPSQEAMAAAERMSPEERSQFVKQMVEGLSARLKANGKDLQGWMRLVRAHKVMGNTSEAATALAEARRNFAGDDAALSTLDALAKSLGLGS